MCSRDKIKTGNIQATLEQKHTEAADSLYCNLILCKYSADVLQAWALTNTARNPCANKELAQEIHLQINI